MGFDPTTTCLQGRCSTRLSYRGLTLAPKSLLISFIQAFNRSS